jgi:3-hydroxyisobutyrate dehydrogenase
MLAHEQQQEKGDVPMTRVGWIGLGAMGAPLAYDIDPGRAQSLATDGVKAATTVSQAAHGAEVLAVMVATPAQVEAVLYGDDPAAAALPPGSVVLVMATVGPAAVHDWATRLATQGLHLVDAPVSGGVARAAAGDLLIMVGAPEATVLKVRPVLDTVARTAPVVGPMPGDGQKVKLVNQLLCGVHIAVAAEALAFAEAMGLDAETTWEVIRHGAAASFMLDDRGQRMVHGSFEQVNSALDIFVKDMGLVVDAARQHDYPVPLAGATEQLYLAGRRAGLGRLDDSSIIEILRDGAAVSPASRRPSARQRVSTVDDQHRLLAALGYERPR